MDIDTPVLHGIDDRAEIVADARNRAEAAAGLRTGEFA